MDFTVRSYIGTISAKFNTLDRITRRGHNLPPHRDFNVVGSLAYATTTRHALTGIIDHEVEYSAATEEIQSKMAEIESKGYGPDLAGRIDRIQY
ncbi:uncharacterized protein AB675_3506 [Cyphellophora attinorum]|uniref:Uncharacterized protein n=1 Tax=Cyphellophora attinorum TaxID=1664694 RepID=A0A0N1H402_9EURO|nr:uncharacterized protein AB675_3506 [Phialophora attinorum]KPI39797.1 hypothetical protein AB675_3506 [Phialophora attinorum]